MKSDLEDGKEKKSRKLLFELVFFHIDTCVCVRMLLVRRMKWATGWRRTCECVHANVFCLINFLVDPDYVRYWQPACVGWKAREVRIYELGEVLGIFLGYICLLKRGIQTHSSNGKDPGESKRTHCAGRCIRVWKCIPNKRVLLLLLLRCKMIPNSITASDNGAGFSQIRSRATCGN